MIEYAISACLCGVNTRYDGGSKLHPKCKKLLDEGKAIIICPEVFGDLSVPRVPCEIVGDKVINRDGEDKTIEFTRGANVALTFIKQCPSIHTIIVKDGSPSCGVHTIYDGTFTGKKIEGQGIFTRQLQGYRVLSEDELDNIDF